MNIFRKLFFRIFLVTNINRPYPTKVDNKEPLNTPIFTPSRYSLAFEKAKFPTNKLMVKPIPAKTPTPYNLIQFEFEGISANLNFIDR